MNKCHRTSDVAWHVNLPRVVVRGRGDGTATKYRLVLHEVQPTTGEDRAIGDQQVLGDPSV
jgi:hypothetical protein